MAARGRRAVASFPGVSTSTPLGSYSGGDMTISSTGLNPAVSGWFYLGLTDAAFATTSIDQDSIATAAGTSSTLLTLPQVAGTLTHREIRVASYDAYWRTMMTVLNY